ncbi:hypothetical protein ILUMI_00805 [Ignelater luminosus]|uniref:Uncharacterized protein n=1 Tax=Ignelater luminosus TaxID=2038154 RepID=A0A8K0DKW9_IGNLU|nr:hypothetical protein ILUMI_00805 [Ignelater luminosus]
MEKAQKIIKIQQHTSGDFEIKQGLRQGGGLALLLSNIALDKVVKATNVDDDGTILNKERQIVGYEDDLDLTERFKRALTEGCIPQLYVRRTERNYDDTFNLIAAEEGVINKGMFLRDAARKHNVVKFKLGYVMREAKQGSLAFQFAKRNGLYIPESWEKNDREKLDGCIYREESITFTQKAQSHQHCKSLSCGLVDDNQPTHLIDHIQHPQTLGQGLGQSNLLQGGLFHLCCFGPSSYAADAIVRPSENSNQTSVTPEHIHVFPKVGAGKKMRPSTVRRKILPSSSEEESVPSSDEMSESAGEKAKKKSNSYKVYTVPQLHGFLRNDTNSSIIPPDDNNGFNDDFLHSQIYADDALLYREMFVNDNGSKSEEIYFWYGNFIMSCVTHVRSLNFGRERAWTKSIHVENNENDGTVYGPPRASCSVTARLRVEAVFTGNTDFRFPTGAGSATNGEAARAVFGPTRTRCPATTRLEVGAVFADNSVFPHQPVLPLGTGPENRTRTPCGQ